MIFSNISVPSRRTRAITYAALLAAINFCFVKNLFFADFTDNMQTNAGSFMAISRFLIRYWPHVTWFPWWFNGEPIENSYSPLLNVADALFAWIAGASVGRAYNFITALLYLLGPVFLFVFAWRVSRRLETSFFAALLYSLFSPSMLFATFRNDGGGFWNPWRLRTLTFYGEGPHHVVASLLPLVLLLFERALRTRRFGWCVAAGASAALLTLTNTFAATTLLIGGVCLAAVFPPRRMPRAAALLAAIGLGAYIWASPLMPPSLLGIIQRNSQMVDGDYNQSRLFPAQVLLVLGFVCLWFATLDRIRDRFTRFCWLLAYVLVAITAYNAVFNIAVLPQPHRYALEMELAVSLAVAFTARGFVVRLPTAVRVAALIPCAALAVHQFVQFQAYGREHTRKIDVTQTVDYQAAQWIAANLPGQRIFAGGETGTWLDAFADIPQMHSGHDPFSPNWTEEGAAYALYVGQNTGDYGAGVSILWLKAFGSHAILIGPSRYYGEVFKYPDRFDGVLPLLWQSGRFTLYGVPQRTNSLAHVVPATAIVRNKPIHGLDTGEVEQYVAALDDPAAPPAGLVWRDPSHGRIESAQMKPAEVLSVQTTWDRGSKATANGHPARITHDGIGLMVIHPLCDGPCTVDLTFSGGIERRACFIASGALTLLVGLAGLLIRRRRRPPVQLLRLPREQPATHVG